jgi:hypothetical protein
MSKHTPGHWRVTKYGGQLQVLADDQCVIADVGTWLNEDAAESEANAQLLATAPELLKALQGIKERTDALKLNHPEWASMIEACVHQEDFTPIHKATHGQEG